MRQIPSVHNAGNGLRITAEESNSRGGATHRYHIAGFDTSQNRAARDGGFVPRFRDMTIILSTDQNGDNVQPNGVTPDALLAVLEDHFQSRVAGPSGTLNQQLAADLIKGAREALEMDEATQMQAAPHQFQRRTAGAHA